MFLVVLIAIEFTRRLLTERLLDSWKSLDVGPCLSAAKQVYRPVRFSFSIYISQSVCKDLDNRPRPSGISFVADSLSDICRYDLQLFR